MYAGISGLRNFQTKLDVIGNNIANVNTFGYKKGRVTFKEMMNQQISGASAPTENRGGQNAIQIGLGGALASIDTVTTQGSLQTTGRDLDLGINGDGFFVVQQGNETYFTRAGNFYLDDNGTLVNSGGYVVQSYVNGSLEPFAINTSAVMPAKPTTTMNLSDNLSKQGINGQTEVVQQTKVIDSLGNEHKFDVVMAKTSNTEWTLTINEEVAGTISFNADGTFNEVTGATGDFDFDATSKVLTWSHDLDGDGTNDSDVGITFNGLTSLDGSNTAVVKANGNAEGSLTSYSAGSSGEINGVYSNGVVEQLGTIALATFSNPGGLSRIGNNLFQESTNSGLADIDVPGKGRGTISSGSLEMSNVDISEEFTEMITAQRGFQANTRIITTSDEILQELVNLKR